MLNSHLKSRTQQCRKSWNLAQDQGLHLMWGKGMGSFAAWNCEVSPLLNQSIPRMGCVCSIHQHPRLFPTASNQMNPGHKNCSVYLPALPVVECQTTGRVECPRTWYQVSTCLSQLRPQYKILYQYWQLMRFSVSSNYPLTILYTTSALLSWLFDHKENVLLTWLQESLKKTLPAVSHTSNRKQAT